MGRQNLGKSSLNIDPNVAALLCYLAGWVTGLIFYLLEKDNKFIRFHAMQSIITFGGLNVLLLVVAFIPVIGILSIIVWFLMVVLWIVLMVKAYQGEYFKLPIAGEIAEKNS